MRYTDDEHARLTQATIRAENRIVREAGLRPGTGASPEGHEAYDDACAAIRTEELRRTRRTIHAERLALALTKTGELPELFGRFAQNAELARRETLARFAHDDDTLTALAKQDDSEWWRWFGGENALLGLRHPSART